ncbi:MAG: JAB domain-containing protein [Pseudomonadota bacterium]
MKNHHVIDDIRALPDAALLQQFFHADTRQILAECNESLLAVLARRNCSKRQRTLLAGIEVARRAVLEELSAMKSLTSPCLVNEYLHLHFLGCEEERFCAVWLDARNRPIAFDELFRGTLTQASVYPREVARRALQRNAASVIFAHNHPSGTAEPSHADELLTQNLKKTLALVDVRVLDHFIVAGAATLSFAQRGLL